MSFAPFLAASPTIQIHAIAATLALVLGPIAIYRDRRDVLHKWIVVRRRQLQPIASTTINTSSPVQVALAN